MRLKDIYYILKPLMPRRLQLALRRIRICCKRSSYADVWPIYDKAGRIPDGFRGWPDGKKVALILTHDVETEKGQDKCRPLAKLEAGLDFRSSFFFVPERYQSSDQLRRDLVEKGFEIGVHGLNHDGKLYRSREEFRRRAKRINTYIESWGSRGFASPGMHHNLEWIHDLNIKYDISSYDTDPFEPQGCGIGTIYPFCVQNSSSSRYYIELPYTLPQDFTLFVLMRQKNIDTWKSKVDWIFEKGGMIHLKTHPDYMNFGESRMALEEYPIDYYTKFLEYIKDSYGGQYWHVLPSDLASFWSSHGSSDNERRNLPVTSEILCSTCRDAAEKGCFSVFPLTKKERLGGE